MWRRPLRAHSPSHYTHARYTLCCCWWSLGSQSSSHTNNHCVQPLCCCPYSCFSSSSFLLILQVIGLENGNSYCFCMSDSCHCIQRLLLYRGCISLGCKHWCALLCSAFCILESLVKLLQVSFLVVRQFLLQRLDDLIFVSEDTVKLLELSALLIRPLLMLLGHILLGLRFKTLHCLSLLCN